MNFAYLWAYTLLLVFIWGFFVVAKLHAYKFKNFSNHIVNVTNILFIFLVILSILWYVVLFFNTTGVPNTASVIEPMKDYDSSLDTPEGFKEIDFEEITY